MDFTLKKYTELLTVLQGYGNIMLRHDVDKKPLNSLMTARIEAELGWKAVYYFRAVPESWDENVIREIHALGHEIGYHYECMTTCDGDVDAAWHDFLNNLQHLRAIAPVSKICMHGSPRSKWDSRDMWKKYDYRTAGIDHEPYLDTDFSKTFYLTDTGRRWDGYKVSVRDKIPEYQDQWISQGLVFHSTDQIIAAAKAATLPRDIMITTHPQRWMPFGISWMLEFAMQNIKNTIKAGLIHTRQTLP